MDTILITKHRNQRDRARTNSLEIDIRLTPLRLLLLPSTFIFPRPATLAPFNVSFISKICLLGLIGFSGQMLGYTGISYSSPTLASGIVNLTPAFTFILAVIFRMEKLALRSSSTQAKIMGTIVSISGAIIVVLYKGPTLSISSPSSSVSLHQSLGSSQSNWVIGSLLLTAEYLLFSIWYIVQTQIMKAYPAELLIAFLYNLRATIISAPGLFGSFFGTLVHTWGLRLKGPVYISMFKPLSIAIAAAMGVIFLGDSLYLGSVIGAIIISIGFYAVMWGKAKEDMGEDCSFIGSLEFSSEQKFTALQSFEAEET